MHTGQNKYEILYFWILALLAFYPRSLFSLEVVVRWVSVSSPEKQVTGREEMTSSFIYGSLGCILGKISSLGFSSLALKY